MFLSLDLDPERDGTRVQRAARVRPARRCWSTQTTSGTGDAIPSEAYVGTVAVAAPTTRAGRRRGRRPERDLRALDHRDPRGRSAAAAPTRSARAGRDPRPGGTATFPIDVPDAGTIDHVALRLDVTHTFMRGSRRDARGAGRQSHRPLRRHRRATSVGSPHTRMLTLFDDNAGTPPVYDVAEGARPAARPAAALEPTSPASRRREPGSSRSATTRARTSASWRART